MTSIPALDVAIGMSVVFLLLSTVVSAAREAFASLRNVRGKTLERWLRSVLGSPSPRDGVPDPVSQFYGSPVVRALSLGSGGGSKRLPSYIPSQHFVTAVLHVGREGYRDGELSDDAFERIGQELEGLPDGEVKRALTDLHQRVEGDARLFRVAAESWFDDCMERLSGWYRRHTQLFVWVGSAVLVVAVNADALQLAQRLWDDPGLRSAVTASAGNPSAGLDANGAIGELRSLPLPLGWGTMHWHLGTWDSLWHVFGWTMSLLAVSLGAPFWFDTLSRIARIRGSGAPPPATGATRRGDAEQPRQGPPAIGTLPTNP
jgi:hypothetical protein